jgi:hypothetical protein
MTSRRAKYTHMAPMLTGMGGRSGTQNSHACDADTDLGQASEVGRIGGLHERLC